MPMFIGTVARAKARASSGASPSARDTAAASAHRAPRCSTMNTSSRPTSPTPTGLRSRAENTRAGTARNRANWVRGCISTRPNRARAAPAPMTRNTGRRIWTNTMGHRGKGAKGRTVS